MLDLHVQEFVNSWQEVGGACFVVSTEEELIQVLNQILLPYEKGAVSTWDLDTYDLWPRNVVNHISRHTCQFTELEDIKKQWKHINLGVSSADYAVSETGSLVLIADKKRIRSVSLLPLHHVVLLHDTSIVPTMGEVWRDIRRRFGKNVPSAITFITGPSRSADIEGDLSIGVHGPAKVSVILFISNRRS